MASFSFASAQGPLHPTVLAELQDEIGPQRGAGKSLLELPFSSAQFEAIRFEAEQSLRRLLGLTGAHRVLFLQGGATAQFALAPMNLLRRGEVADHVVTGLWSRRAAEAAAVRCDVRVAALGDGRFLPPPESWRRSTGAVYCHVTSNETAEGLQYEDLSVVGEAPLVADMTADFLTRPIPLAPFGLIYASAQKNLGVAGLTLVVIHENLLERCRGVAPAPFNYALQAAERSRINTPPTFAIAVAGKTLRWLGEAGGLAGAQERAAARSEAIYSVIDEDGFYAAPARKSDRSVVSVRFHLVDPVLEAEFAAKAEAEGLLHLRGHPSVGGFRASLYNGLPQAAAEALAAFMRDFRHRSG